MIVDSLIRKLNQFRPISEAEQNLLNDAVSHVGHVKAGNDIILEGERPDEVHLVLAGWAGRYKILPDGQRQIMAYLIPGDLCDIHIALLNRMDHAIGALSDCRIAYFSRNAISRVMESHPELGMALWWATLVDEAVLREWLVSLGGRPADKRVAHLMCEMLLRTSLGSPEHRDRFEMPLRQEQLADSMGMSTVHMNRTMQKLRRLGLLETDGSQMLIKDFERLKEFCGFDATYLHQEAQVRD